jgi:hypothetical protein
MSLDTRIIRVTLGMDSGDVVLDESLDLHVRIRKDALSIQNRCTIEVKNLTQTLRAQLLSQFTAYNLRHILTGETPQKNYAPVTVELGYATSNGPKTFPAFSGQVVMATMTSAPPSIGMSIECFANQELKLTFVTTPPTRATFKQYCEWAGDQMGVSHVICETQYNDRVIFRPSGSTEMVSALLVDIQTMFRPRVAAYIDNNVLVVKDLNKVVTKSSYVEVNEFIGVPIWTDYGVEFVSLVDPQILLDNVATLTSKMNPGINGKYVIGSLEYDCASRQAPFYVKAGAAPPA